MNPRLESCAMVASSQPIPKLRRDPAPQTMEEQLHTMERVMQLLQEQVNQLRHDNAILRSQVNGTTNLHPAIGLIEHRLNVLDRRMAVLEEIANVSVVHIGANIASAWPRDEPKPEKDDDDDSIKCEHVNTHGCDELTLFGFGSLTESALEEAVMRINEHVKKNGRIALHPTYVRRFSPNDV